MDCTICGLVRFLFGCIENACACALTSTPAIFVVSVIVTVVMVLQIFARSHICEKIRERTPIRAVLSPSPCPSANSGGLSNIATSTTIRVSINQKQSPINIIDQFVQKYPIRELLTWTHYNDIPLSVTLENTGRTVKVSARYSQNTPTLCGADLLESYSFVELYFRWSMFNSEGSEHMLNYKKYPLELQVMHHINLTNVSQANYDVLMVSYLYEIIHESNPFLNPITINLNRVQKPNTRVNIEPFPLSYLCHQFRSGFYSYGGSLTDSPCNQGAEWFIFPEPLAISLQQLDEFRQLLCHDGKNRIISNANPVQNLCSTRTILLNQYSLFDAPPLPECDLSCEEEQNINVERV